MTITEETDLKSLRDALLILQQELNTIRGFMIKAKHDYNDCSWWNPNRKVYLSRFSQYSQQYKEKRATYDQLLSKYNQKVAFYNQDKSSKIATPPPVGLVSPTKRVTFAEVPNTNGTIQEVVSNQKPKQVVVSKPIPKLAPTIVINDDNMEELDDDLELNDALIDDDLELNDALIDDDPELNDTPVVGVGDAEVSYNGTVYRMPTEVAAGVSALKESGGTGTLSKNVKYSGDTGKVLIRKGNWRKNPYVIKENDGTTYKTNNLEKFLQHIAALEAE